jgi:hypothetical protein
MSKIDKKEVTEILRAFLILFIIGLTMVIGIKAIIFNFGSYDIVNPKETIIATYSNNDISNQIKNNKENKYIFYDDENNVKLLNLPNMDEYSNDHKYKYEIDDTLGNTIVIKDVIATGRKDLSQLNKFERKLVFKKNRNQSYYIVTGSKENIEKILRQID